MLLYVLANNAPRAKLCNRFRKLGNTRDKKGGGGQAERTNERTESVIAVRGKFALVATDATFAAYLRPRFPPTYTLPLASACLSVDKTETPSDVFRWMSAS